MKTTDEHAANRRGSASSIDDDTWQLMQGRSWHEHPECPGRNQLALLSIPYLNFDGRDETGEMIVATSVADDVLSLFAELRAADYPIASIRLIDHFDGDDDASMAANNSSAFNFREIVGGTGLSEHSFGTAIDVNPVQNPYVFDGNILPPAGAPYADPASRVATVPGMIVADGPVVAAFQRIGWHWGGAWTTKKDYHHFSKTGR
ncbi:MAG: M15 family metallopeptidase [Pseudomonadota bacterium]